MPRKCYAIADTTFLMSSPDPEFTLSAIVSSDDSVDSESMEETGTWVRDGNTLTLPLIDGQVVVFKKL